MGQSERAKAYRDRKRGGPAPDRELAPHGTRAAIARHQRDPEQHGPVADCSACAEERRRLNREAQARRRARLAAEG
jgi:hypothetical protein